MPILGISSATKVISIGLIDEDRVLVETTVSDIRAEKIMFYVKEAGIEPSQIEGSMAVILDAKSDEYNFALFGASQKRLKRLTDDLILKFDKMLDKLSKISGEIYLVGKVNGIRGEMKGKNYHFAGDLHSHPYGINVARSGLLKIKAGGTSDPLKLTPNYSHKPNIREFKN